MFILVFFVVVALSQHIVNQLMGISLENAESYTLSHKDSLYIVVLFVLGIFLQIFVPLIDAFDKMYWYLVFGYVLALTIVMSLAMVQKRARIEKQQESIKLVYEILQRLVDKKNKGLDFNNVPFTLYYKYGNINRIDVVVEPTTFDEKQVEAFLPQLNNFFPNFDWRHDLHLEERYFSFVGSDKPPQLARWMGSHLRHFLYMPVGVSGDGEVAWKPDDVPKDKMFESSFLDEKGNPIPTKKVHPNPQGLVCGAPLTLDTIIPTPDGYTTMGTIRTGDRVFTPHNTPTTVIWVQDIHFSDCLYGLVCENENHAQILVRADDIHRFPLVKEDNKISITECQHIQVGDVILGNNDNHYAVVSKRKLDNQFVRCITVDSDEHMFLITNTKDDNWHGGETYTGDAIATMNTGGGKAIWVEQEIDD